MTEALVTAIIKRRPKQLLEAAQDGKDILEVCMIDTYYERELPAVLRKGTFFRNKPGYKRLWNYLTKMGLSPILTKHELGDNGSGKTVTVYIEIKMP